MNRVNSSTMSWNKILFSLCISLLVSIQFSLAFMQCPITRTTTTSPAALSIPHVLQQQQQKQQSSTRLFMARSPTIDKWSLASNGGITGIVKNSPNPRAFRDGEGLTTSKIISNRNLLKEGATITTESGSQYKLGIPKASKPNTGRQQQNLQLRPRPPSVPSIRNWTINLDGTVTGNVYGGPKKRNGESVKTSKITSNRDAVKEGDIVTTVTGSKYRLEARKKPQYSFPSISRKSPSLFAGTTKPRPAPLTPSPAPSTRALQDESPKPKQRKTSSPFDALPKRDTRPAPFANLPSSQKQQNDDDDKVPILDNWSVNRKEQITGIVSNSPIARERDGKTITTREILTDPAFIVEGFTIVAMDGRKFKLGYPKAATATKNENNTDEVVVYGTPTLLDWDVEGGEASIQNGETIRLVGIMKDTNDPKISNGQVITTGEIITSMEFLEEGFSVVSASGTTYKLGRRDKTGIRRRQAFNSATSGVESESSTKSSSFQFPSVSAPKLPEIKTPSFAGKKEEESKSTSSNDTNSIVNKNIRPLRPATKKATRTVPATLENWTLGDLGRVTGTIAKSDDDRDGQVLTTAQSTTPSMLFREGVTVYAEDGTSYKLGTKSLQPDPAIARRKKKEKEQARKKLFQRSRVTIALIDDWSMTGMGGITGIVSNSQDPSVEDGDILTTSKIMTEDIREGQIVETMNGSVYILGSRSKLALNTTPIESPETPVAAGLWVVAGLLFLILNRGMY